MTFSLSIGPSAHTYTFGDVSEIQFFKDTTGLTAAVETKQLYMRSVRESDIDSYAALFGSPDVMGNYAIGKTKTREEIATLIKESWNQRWKHHDPYSALAVFQADTEKFLGHIILDRGDVPGHSELSFLFLKDFWNKSFETEAVTEIVQHYALATVSEKYTLGGKLLETIKVATRTDTPTITQILEKIGMKNVGQKETCGALYSLFSLQVSELLTRPVI